MKKRLRQEGTSLVELLISVSILVVVLVGVLILFDLNSRVARVQTDVADMQQSLRAVQNEMVLNVRMAGRGQLPALQLPDPDDPITYPGKLLPNGVAIEVRNDVAANSNLVDGDTITPEVVEGTDVLTIRGVFSTPIYQANPATSLTLDSTTNPTTGQVVLISPSTAGVPQDFTPLNDAAVGDALVLVSPIDDSIYAVVEVTSVSIAGGTATVDFRVQAGTNTDKYADLSPLGRFPAALTTVAYVGVLEEYRYYVRELYAIQGDDTSDLTPTLARARFFPGTDTAWDNDNINLTEDLADNILDLQVALGIDRDGDGLIEDGPDAVTIDPADDDWLFNDAADDPAEQIAGVPVWGQSPLFYIRLNTLARTDRRDREYVSPPLQAIEDSSYAEPALPANDPDRLERMYRRRLLQTVVDMRNLS